MFAVNVYIENDQRDFNRRAGWYGAVVEYRKTNGELETREKFGLVEATCHQMTLIALIESLKILSKECHVTVYMDSDYICNMITQNRHLQWQRNNWRKANNDPIANQKEWQQLTEQLAKHRVEITNTKGHAYSAWLKEEIRKRKG